MSDLIDGDELITWIKESQHQTSKMRNVVCKVEVMQDRESKWTLLREDGDILKLECPKCRARYALSKRMQRMERTRWKCCPICLTPVNGWRKKNERSD